MRVRFLADTLVSEDGGPYDPQKPSRTYPAGYVLDLTDGDAGNFVNRGLAEEVADEPAPAPAPAPFGSPAPPGLGRADTAAALAPERA